MFICLQIISSISIIHCHPPFNFILALFHIIYKSGCITLSLDFQLIPFGVSNKHVQTQITPLNNQIIKIKIKLIKEKIHIDLL